MITRLVVLALLAAHALQASLYPQTMNVRTTFAIGVFAACAGFADRVTDQPYALPLLRAFGLIGMLLPMIVLQLNAPASS